MSSKPEPLLSERDLEALAQTARQVRDRFAAWRRGRLGLRGVLLYLLPMPLALAGLVALAKGMLGPAVAAAAAFFAVIGGAYLNRRGIREELIAPERRYTRAIRLPYKYLAAGLVATGTAVAAYAVVGQGVLVSIAFAALAVTGFHLTYRLPPPAALRARSPRETRDKPLQRALQQAENRILSIEEAALGIGNQELEQRLQRIAVQGRAILDTIAERPAELYRARKFLNVYLEGAERVASRYAKTHRLARTEVLEHNFRNVLVEIESVFERQRTQLLEHDVFDLDVKIEVLRRQLEHEGIT
jgi:hypothetical protein